MIVISPAGWIAAALEANRQLDQDLKRRKVEQGSCPVCEMPLQEEKGKLVCKSGICLYRVVINCCGD